MPLMRSEVVLSAGPKTTSATSDTRVCGLMRMLPISSADLALASARTSSVRLASEMVPAGASSATLPSAELRSAMVSPWAASAFGSMMIWTIGSRSPKTCTSATPSTAASRVTMVSLTTLVRSWIDMVVEVAARRMMASELASALTMVGGVEIVVGGQRAQVADGVAEVVGGDVDVGLLVELDRHLAAGRRSTRRRSTPRPARAPRRPR